MDLLVTVELFSLFFFIAMLYASVGFGGGSSYLALLAIFGLQYQALRAAALLCNITVVTSGTYIFYKNGHLKWKKVLPLVIVSVPLAYLGGTIQIKEKAFFILLGVVLILAAILMLWQTLVPQKENNPIIADLKDTPLDWPAGQASSNEPQISDGIVTSGGLGGSIGFLSGLVGIGGGIFLAPILHLLSWDKTRVIAATASFFILVNSIAGLAGQLSHPEFSLDWTLMIILMVAVFLGGQIGSRLGASWLEPIVVKRLTAGLIFFVGLRILWQQLATSAIG